jgi:hypothetical protein
MLAVPEIGGWPRDGYFYHPGNAISHSDFAGEPRAESRLADGGGQARAGFAIRPILLPIVVM